VAQYYLNTDRTNPKDDASFLFKYLGDVWSSLPAADKRVLSDFWRGMVQVAGDLYTEAQEDDLSVGIFDIPVYNNVRWNYYYFNNDTFIGDGIYPSPAPSGYTDPDGLNLIPAPSGYINLTYPYAYSLGNSKIVIIPTLQDRTDKPYAILENTIDYITDSNGYIYFKQDPSSYFPSESPFHTTKKLYAKNTFVNNERPYKNFGVLVDYYDTNSPQYLNILRSMWFAYWTGPRPQNIKVTLCLLFGLPVAINPGIVNEITDRISVNIRTVFGDGFNVTAVTNGIHNLVSGQIITMVGWGAGFDGNYTIVVTSPTTFTYAAVGVSTTHTGTAIATGNTVIKITDIYGIQTSYILPTGTVSLVTVGQQLTQYFNPLSTGVEVIDKIIKPGFVTTDVGRQGIRKYLTEQATLGSALDTDETMALTIMEDSLFLVEIDINSISRTVNLFDVQNFLRNIKPHYTDYVLQVILNVTDDIIVLGEQFSNSSQMSMDITLTYDFNMPNTINDPMFNDYATVGNINCNLDEEGLCPIDTTTITVRDSLGDIIDYFMCEL